MRLKAVRVENFRKFENKEVQMDERITTLSWENRAGKTTIADAIAWALTGKLYNGSSDIASIKPKTNSKAKASVELEFETGWTGERPATVTLRKEFEEAWVRTRGTDIVTMTGHTTQSYINGVKQSETEYERAVLSMFNIKDKDYTQALNNVYYFSTTMPWQKRREILMALIGQITAADVFQKAPETKQIDELLKKYGYDAPTAKKNVEQAIKGPGGLKEIIKDLTSKIDGAKILNPVSSEEYNRSKELISENKEKIVALKVAKSSTENPEVKVKQGLLNQAIQEKAQCQEADAKDLEAINSEVAKRLAFLDDLIKKHSTNEEKTRSILSLARGLLTTKTGQIAAQKQNKQRLEYTINNLSHEFDTIAESKIEAQTVRAKCPDCGCEFDITINEAEVQKFQIEKVKRIEGINAAGVQAKEEIKAIDKFIQETETVAEQVAKDIEAYTTELQRTEKSLQELKSDRAKETEKMRYHYVSKKTEEAAAKVSQIQETIRNLQEENREVGQYQEAVKKLEEETASLEAIVDRYNAQAIILKNKMTLEERMQAETKKLAARESEADLLNVYTKTKIEIMNDRLVSIFPDIRFQLVQENIKQDSWDEVCYVLDPTPNGMVPYATTNTESQIRLGVKIIETIRDGLGIEHLPIVIDNAEAITLSNRTFSGDSQIICMVASEEQ